MSELEVFSEAILPVETIAAEILSHADEFTRFALSWTCRYLASNTRNSSHSLPFFELMADFCENGNLDSLKFWFPWGSRPRALEFANIAAFHGHISILDWLFDG